MNPGNGHTHCCGFEPMLRVSDQRGAVYFHCRICSRKGSPAASNDWGEQAGMHWEAMILRASKKQHFKSPPNAI